MNHCILFFLVSFWFSSLLSFFALICAFSRTGLVRYSRLSSHMVVLILLLPLCRLCFFVYFVLSFFMFTMLRRSFSTFSPVLLSSFFSLFCVLMFDFRSYFSLLCPCLLFSHVCHCLAARCQRVLLLRLTTTHSCLLILHFLPA